MPYATLAELKAFVGISDANDDATLTLALDSASAQVDHFCDRTFSIEGVAEARVYFTTDAGRLDVDPIGSVTGLVVKTDDNDDGTFETTWVAGTDYRLEPPNAVANGVPYTRLVTVGTRYFPLGGRWPRVEVTALYGWPGGVAPAPVKHATLIQASRLWKRKDAPFGVAGSVEFGSEIRLLARLDPDVEALLRPYRRQWWVL